MKNISNYPDLSTPRPRGRITADEITAVVGAKAIASQAALSIAAAARASDNARLAQAATHAYHAIAELDQAAAILREVVVV